MKTYTAWGPVRGGCRHNHKSMKAAETCAAKDRRECRELGGGAYSDRYGHRSDCAAVNAKGLLWLCKCDCPENTYPKQEREA